jgi:hypothetical protein
MFAPKYVTGLITPRHNSACGRDGTHPGGSVDGPALALKSASCTHPGPPAYHSATVRLWHQAERNNFGSYWGYKRWAEGVDIMPALNPVLPSG